MAAHLKRNAPGVSMTAAKLAAVGENVGSVIINGG